MQKLVANLRALGETGERSQFQAPLTADNSSINVIVASEAHKDSSDKRSEAERETSIVEMLDFAKSFLDVLSDDKSTKLVAKAKQVFNLQGLATNSSMTRQRIENIRDTMEQTASCLVDAVQRIDTYWKSMTKFSYLS